MINDKSNHKPVILAAITASVLMLAFGLTYHTLAARLLTPLSMTPINPAALDDFPLQINDWTGKNVPLDEAEVILDKICGEAMINRLYSRDNGAQSILLFIAASGVTAGTMVGHAPEICNVMAGYTLTNQHSVKLSLGDGTELSCRVLRFSRSGLLDTEKRTVLYYYMADGQFCGNRSQLRSRVRRGSNMVNCIAQVQIVASSKETLTTDSTVKIVYDFAVESASSIAELFERIQNDQSAHSTDPLEKEGGRQ